MSEIRTEQDYLDSLPQERRDAIRDTLVEWRDAGNPLPQIGAEVDIAGDGQEDYFRLDSFGNLILVAGADVDQSDYDLDGVDIVEETEGVGFDDD